MCEIYHMYPSIKFEAKIEVEYVIHGVEEASAFLIQKLKPIENEDEDNEDVFSLREDIFVNAIASG